MECDYQYATCREFADALASSEPVPGGGGAAALVGAVGAALGNMAAALTVGKKKYAAVENEIREASEKCAALREELLNAIRADAEGFAPLAAAYAIPKDDPSRAATLEAATVRACEVPMRILELCAQVSGIIQVFAEKGSRLAVSDAGCAAACVRASAQSAILNIYINTKLMQNRVTAEELNHRAEKLLRKTEEIADAVYAKIADELRQEK